jgi:hypothetical protein
MVLRAQPGKLKHINAPTGVDVHVIKNSDGSRSEVTTYAGSHRVVTTFTDGSTITQYTDKNGNFSKAAVNTPAKPKQHAETFAPVRFTNNNDDSTRWYAHLYNNLAVESGAPSLVDSSNITKPLAKQQYSSVVAPTLEVVSANQTNRGISPASTANGASIHRAMAFLSQE